MKKTNFCTRKAASGSPAQAVTELRGADAVHTLHGVTGPTEPLLIEAIEWGFVAGIISLALEAVAQAASPDGKAPRPGLVAASLVRGPDGRLHPQVVAGQNRDAQPGHGAVPGGPDGRAEVVSVRFQKGRAGKVVMPVQNAWDRERLRLAGAPVVAVWSEPDTEVCQFAVISKPDAESLRGTLFRCATARPHGSGAIVMSYEDGKLGPSNGPAVKFMDGAGAQSAAPIFCLEGSRVSPAAHAAGRMQPFSGEGLADALVAQAEGRTPAGFGFPGGETVCSIDGLSSEFARAQQMIRGWLSGREPNLRRSERAGALAGADLHLLAAVRGIDAAQSQLAALKAGGAGAVLIDFGAFNGSPASFAGDVSAAMAGQDGIRLAQSMAVHGAQELGTGLALRRQA